MTREDFEAKAQEFVGRRVTAVRYFELDYGQPPPAWNRDGRFDSLDFGLEFSFEADVPRGVFWWNEFYPYGVSIRPAATALEPTIRAQDVSGTGRWRSLIGERIAGVRSTWDAWHTVGGPSHPFPFALSFRFESGARIFVAALEIQGTRCMGGTDHITVFSDAELAAHHGIDTGL